MLRDSAEGIVKNWTIGCSGCPNEPFATTVRFVYRVRAGNGVPYDDTAVVMNLPAEIVITASPLQCDHCPVDTPEWCKALPRPEYKSTRRVRIAKSDPDLWFEVYKVAADTYAIYEPRQFEEVISYLIVGKQKALLFDTGMGIGNIRAVVEQLMKDRGPSASLRVNIKPPLPVIVLNSHTHNDHVGDNWRFDIVYSMDTEFSRQNAKGSYEDAQAEIMSGQICGNLPQFFNGSRYRTEPWTISKYLHDGEQIGLGGRTIEVLAVPGHTPDAIALFDRAHGLLFTGDTYYPAPIWLYRPETDLDAYAKSIARLAALAPQVTTVLGSHNVPVSPPAVLPALASAFADLRAGNANCKADSPGKQVCTVRGFSFLLRSKP